MKTAGGDLHKHVLACRCTRIGSKGETDHAGHRPTRSPVPLGDQGKYVVVWKKLHGEWKVLADIFNSDRTSP